MKSLVRFIAPFLLFAALLAPASSAAAAPERFDFSFSFTSPCDGQTVHVQGEASSDSKFQDGAHMQRYNLIGTAYSEDQEYVFHQRESFRLVGSDDYTYTGTFILVSTGSGPNMMTQYTYNPNGIHVDGQIRCLG